MEIHWRHFHQHPGYIVHRSHGVDKSQHALGRVLEQSVDMCGFHNQHAWLVRNAFHVKARLMKAAAAGGLWPAARLRAGDERYDGLCPRCLAEGLEVEETILHRVLAMHL